MRQEPRNANDQRFTDGKVLPGTFVKIWIRYSKHGHVAEKAKLLEILLMRMVFIAIDLGSFATLVEEAVAWTSTWSHQGRPV